MLSKENKDYLVAVVEGYIGHIEVAIELFPESTDFQEFHLNKLKQCIVELEADYVE